MRLVVKLQSFATENTGLPTLLDLDHALLGGAQAAKVIASSLNG
ncbi:hypothetical protein ACVW1A_001335 [Bradyrhizobium sp. LB1.3]